MLTASRNAHARVQSPSYNSPWYHHSPAKRRDTLAQQPPKPDALTRLADQLHGLLSIRIDEPFFDLDHLCPCSAWLVIHLDLIRPVTSIPLALDALAVLCVRSERLRLDDKLHEVYWRQMLTSDIMRDTPSADSPTVAKFIRFVKRKNVRVMLSWEGKRFQSAIATSLRHLFEASTAKYDAIADSIDGSGSGRTRRSLDVGIQFADSSITRGDIKAIKAMLTDVNKTTLVSRVSHLCEQRTLIKLDLGGNRIGLQEVRELASLLEDPQSRRIDDPALEHTFPDDVASSIDKNYVAAFERVITAALTAKPVKKASTYVRADADVAISLARNTMYDGLHLNALHDALPTASRCISALSLAYTKHEQTEAIKSSSQQWLARICMTSSSTSFTEDALLDLTLTDLVLDMDKFYNSLTDVVLPRLREAHQNNITVYCRLRMQSIYYGPIYSYNPYVVESRARYAVVDVLPEGKLIIAPVRYIDSEAEDEAQQATVTETTHFVGLKSISTLYGEDANAPDIMRMRFSSLACHGDNDEYGTTASESTQSLWLWTAKSHSPVCCARSRSIVTPTLTRLLSHGVWNMQGMSRRVELSGVIRCLSASGCDHTMRPKEIANSSIARRL